MQDVNAPIFKGSIPTGFRPQGVATDVIGLPPPIGLVSSGLLTKDGASLDLNFVNTRPFQKVVVQVVADDQGIFNEFLTIDGGSLNGTYGQTFTVLGTISLKAKSLSSTTEVLARGIEADRLYGVKLTVKWFPEGHPELAQTKEAYVYRYLDIADSNHADGTIEFAPTLVDGVEGTARTRQVLFGETNALGETTKFLSDSARQGINFELNSSSHFKVEALSGASGVGLVFDPTSTGPNLQTSVSLSTPGGVFSPGLLSNGLTLKGEAKAMQKIAINKQAFLSALMVLSLESTTLPGLTSAEKLLIDDPAEREAIFSTVDAEFRRVINSQLAPSLSSPIEVIVYDTSLGQTAPSTTDTVLFRSFDRLGDPQAPAAPTVDSQGNFRNLTAGLASQDNDVAGLESLVKNLPEYGRAERAFRLSKLLNSEPGGIIRIYLDTILQAPNGNLNVAGSFDWVTKTNDFNQLRDPDYTPSAIVANNIVATMIHELGHTLGTVHTTGGGSSTQAIGISGASNDFMASSAIPRLLPGQAGYNPAQDFGFQVTQTAFQVAMGLNWNVQEGNRALNYFQQAVAKGLHKESPGSGSRFDAPDPPAQPPHLDGAGVLAINLVEGQNLSTRLDLSTPLDFGTVSVDGPGGAKRTATIELLNFGGTPLNFYDIIVVGGQNRAVTFDPALRTGLILQPGEARNFTLTFDPLVRGDHSFQMDFITDGFGSRSPLRITAVGQSMAGDLQVVIPNANVGGLALNATPQRTDRFGTLKNTGQSALRVYDVRIITGMDQFAMGGLPAFDQKNPLVLAPGASQSFGLLFDAKQLGLQHGTLQIFSDDPETPILTVPVMGTGVLDSDILTSSKAGKYENSFVLLKLYSFERPEEVESIMRTRSDAQGNFEFAVHPGRTYSLEVFDPSSGLVGSIGFRQAGFLGLLGGKVTQADLDVIFHASQSADSNRNGMPDDIDFILGTAAPRPTSSSAPASGSSSSSFGFPLVGPEGPIPRISDSNSALSTPVLSQVEGQSSAFAGLTQAAVAGWQSLGLTASQATALTQAQFTIADLPGSQLALTTGNLTTLDVDAAGNGWFIDPTPLTSEEFAPSALSHQLSALSDSDGADKIDLLTVISHELGHVIGLNDVSPFTSPLLLMTGLLPFGIRRLPSALDLLETGAHSTPNVGVNGSAASAPLLSGSPWSGAQAVHGPIHNDVFNGTLSITDPANSQFGWETRGAVSFTNSAAVLREDDRLLSDLSQSFTVPQNAQSLRFTLTNVNLQSTNGAPPDAFEVAFLDATTLSPLAGVVNVLDHTDSLLNIQANGTHYQSSLVTLTPIGGNGSSYLVDVNLTGLVGRAGTLYFDLLGFGDKTSSVTIDNVLLTNGQPTAAPVAVNDSYIVAEGGTLLVPFASGLLQNDTDSDTSAFSLTAFSLTAPTHGTLTVNADGSFTYTHNGTETLTDSFTYRVSDGINLSNLATVSLTITPVNEAPVLAPIGPKTVNEQTELRFTVSATDVDRPAQTLTYSASGLPIGASIDAATGEFVWTPAEDQGPGSYQVTVSVTDGEFTVSEAVTITVNEVNVAPVLDPIGPKSVNEGSGIRFTIHGSDADMPGQTLAYSAIGLPAGATFDPTTHEFVWTPTEVQGPGSYQVTFSVTDGEFSASEIVTITVNEVNVAPILNAIGPKTVNEETELRFTISGSDVDDPAQTLIYSATPLPPGASFTPATGEFVWTPTEAQGPGSYVVTFSVTDGVVTTSEAVTITVNEVNVAPVLTPIGPNTVAEGSPLSFIISASDADFPTQTLTYSASGLPTGATIDAVTGEFVWTPAEDQGPGSYQVTFSVTDGEFTVSEAVTITVTEVNVAPVPTGYGLFSLADSV